MIYEVKCESDIDKIGPPMDDAPGGKQENAIICRVEDVPNVFDVPDGHDVESIVDGFLPTASVAMFAGLSGRGKSFLSLDLATCVPSERPFAGRHTAQRPVLYLDRENPIQVVKKPVAQLGAAQLHHQLQTWGQWCGTSPPPPDSPILIEWVRRVEPKPLLLFDPLISWHPGDENNATETRRFMDGFRQLATLGATVVLLHHSGSPTTQSFAAAAVTFQHSSIVHITSRSSGKIWCDGETLDRSESRSRLGIGSALYVSPNRSNGRSRNEATSNRAPSPGVKSASSAAVVPSTTGR
jgi:hypothetical protein